MPPENRPPERQHPPRDRPVSLAELVAALDPERSGLVTALTPETGAITVWGLSLDSRRVQPGQLYVALRGEHAHGARFAEQAATRGASAVLTDAEGAEQIGDRLPTVVVTDPRQTMAELAAVLAGQPASRLTTLGVTGTNGKTTTAFLAEAGLLAAGRHPGVIGTIGFRVDQRPLPSERSTVTTPESVDLHPLVARMLEQGADSLVMEVSSHASVLRRTEPIRFDVMAFTNLGRDHLDFHPTMTDYFEAKAALFGPDKTRTAVVNTADPWGARLADRIRAGGQVDLLTTGGPGADFALLEVTALPDQTQRLRLATPVGALTCVLGMPGEYNAANAVTALALLHGVGVDVHRAAAGLATAQVPGRMQRLELPGSGPTVLVDFAHTPQAVASALAAVKSARSGGSGRPAGAGRPGGAGQPGRVVAVLGAGGDRDTAKRGPMGAAAAAGADLVVVTDDNPRSEDPATIRAAVWAGAEQEAAVNPAAGRPVDIGDRRTAIAWALAQAGPEDTVIVLGKGHEQGQDIAGRVSPFDDAQVVADLWAERGRPGDDVADRFGGAR